MAPQTFNETFERWHPGTSATGCGDSDSVFDPEDCLECVYRKTYFEGLCTFAVRSNNTDLQRYLVLCDTTWRCSGANSQFCSTPVPKAAIISDSGLDLSSCLNDFSSYDSNKDVGSQNIFREPLEGSVANKVHGGDQLRTTQSGEPHKLLSIMNASDVERGINRPVPMPRTIFLKESVTSTSESNVEGAPFPTQPETIETDIFSPSQKIRNIDQTYGVGFSGYDANFPDYAHIDEPFHTPGRPLVDANNSTFTQESLVGESPMSMYDNSFESSSDISMKTNVCEMWNKASRNPSSRTGPYGPQVSQHGFNSPGYVPNVTEPRFDHGPSFLQENELDPRSSQGSSITPNRAGEIPPRKRLVR